DKHYVDSQVATSVPLAGGSMTGALATPAVNGIEAPAAGTSQTTLQAAMNAAGATGALEIPPAYAGTDGFTNPNGVFVKDWRPAAAQQVERSVKEFGAVCDGATDDTNALQAAINYAQAHGVALTIPQGTCKTHSLNWHGESIGGLGKQVSALMGFPGEDVLASVTDSTSLLSYTRLHDLTIYVDQSVDVSCTPAEGRAAAGSCTMSRPMEANSIFSSGGNGLTGTAGTGAAWDVGNCAIAMPAATGAGGNGLRVAEIENVEIAATGTDPMAAAYPGAYSTHTCGLYLAQWPQWSEFRNIDIRGLNTGVAIPALPLTAPAGLNADSNRWQNVTIQAAHAFTAAAGSNNVLDNLVAMAGNSAATGEPPTGLVIDLTGTQQGWTVRNAVVLPAWHAVLPALAVTASGGAVTAVTVGTEHGLGIDPYGTTLPVIFSGSCTAAATATVNTNGSIGSVTVTAGGVGCSSTTTASLIVAGTWDTAAPVNLIGGQNMTFFAGNLLKGNGGYTVWNAASSESHGTQLDGGGGTLPGGGSYAALVGSNRVGTAYQVDQFPGADIGAKIQACVNAVSASYGGTCDARNFTGSLSMGSNLAISTANTTVLLPCATIATANQVVVTAGTRNVALRGCALRGGSASSGNQGGTVFEYSGAGAMIQVGDPAYAVDTPGFRLDDVVINTTAASSAAAQGLIAYRTQELDLESLYLLGNQNQTGITLDGTGNYTGGTFLDDQVDGFATAINAIGHQVSNPATTDWVNASTFVRLHIDCPTSGGSPIAGTYGINLQQGDGNTFTGGDVEGCATALHLGANAQNNTIVGLRNENSTNQVVADAGSSYNNWMTGGTMFTGKLTDNGTRNSFLDTFHRSFNGLNGDWYGSQQDATVTNHYRLGTGAGNERGLLDEFQTDYGYRWTLGLSDATGGEQYYQILDQLNNVYRFEIGQYNNGASSTNNQTVINAAGSGAVVLNGSNNAGTGGVVIGSGGSSESTVATISNAGNAQFNGTLQVGGTAQAAGTLTVRNNADAEVDYYLWPGLTASQKGSFTYKDWNGNSQWYMLKDASNNWALNSAVGGLDSFKAYQSTNSGDTYIDASNSTGHIRLNYESGAGAETDIYSGSSSSLVAAFQGPTSIKFPGLAASSGDNCLQVDNSGYITNTGSACGSGGGGGGSGTVNSGTTNQVAVYSLPGTAVAGSNSISLPGTVSAAGVNDTLRPWVDTFTIATPVSSSCGSGTDAFAQLCQLGVNADGTYTFNLFRDTGHSGTTVTASVSPFAPYLTAIPFTGT
ncbi:MAG: glycosyl hydrolase family 28-related protein, partial [Terracidiphilus sp.]